MRKGLVTLTCFLGRGAASREGAGLAGRTARHDSVGRPRWGRAPVKMDLKDLLNG
jgi:hypothetical protein